MTRENLQEEALLRLRRAGALRHGHFCYTSGRHGVDYVNCRVLPEHPKTLAWFVERLVELCGDLPCDVVVGTGTFGAPLAIAVAKRLEEVRKRSVRAHVLHRTDRVLGFAENDAPAPAANIIVVDDTRTTGGTVEGMVTVLERRYMATRIQKVLVICDRSEKQLPEDAKVASVVKIPLRSWSAEECAECRKGIPLDDGKASWAGGPSGTADGAHPQAYAERIVLACDTSNLEEACALVRRLAPWRGVLKIHSLYLRHGPSVLETLRAAGALGPFWVDVKLADIPRTNESSAAAVRASGARILSVHGSSGVPAVGGAIKGFTANGTDDETEVIVISVLSSLSEAEVRRIYNRPVEETVRIMASIAVEAGARQLVCSPLELAVLGNDPDFAALKYNVPGIRSMGVDVRDQKRVSTPRQAIMAGAHRLVVGSQIIDAPDPRLAFEALLAEVAQAAADRVAAIQGAARQSLVLCQGINPPTENTDDRLKM